MKKKDFLWWRTKHRLTLQTQTQGILPQQKIFAEPSVWQGRSTKCLSALGSSPSSQGRPWGQEGHVALVVPFQSGHPMVLRSVPTFLNPKNLSSKNNLATGWQQELSDELRPACSPCLTGSSVTGSKWNNFIVWRKFPWFCRHSPALASGGDGTEVEPGGAHTPLRARPRAGVNYWESSASASETLRSRPTLITI